MQMVMADQNPQRRFLKCLRELEFAIENAVGVSETRMDIQHTGRQNRVLVAFAKMITHAMSIQLLCNSSARNAPDLTLLDHFSVGALTRTLVDASIMTLYLSEPSLSVAEWDLRRHVLFRHDAANRKRILAVGRKRTGIAVPTDDDADYRKQKSSILNVIGARANELGLSHEKIEELSKGQMVFIDGLRGAVREAGINVDEFDFLYAYLSNHVHSHPVSLLRTENFSFDRPTDFQLSFCTLCLSSATAYVEEARKRVESFTGGEDRDPNGHV